MNESRARRDSSSPEREVDEVLVLERVRVGRLVARREVHDVVDGEQHRASALAHRDLAELGFGAGRRAPDTAAQRVHEALDARGELGR